jgi:leader peptidase (prepilin peptidase)/N-methyltransferase
MIDAPATPTPPSAAATLPSPTARRALPHTPSLRRPPVLGVTVALAATVGALQPTVPTAVLRAVLVLVLVPCALIDVQHRIIPNRITGPAALVAIALGLGLAPGAEPGRLLWAALAGGFLLIAALVYPAGMGMGDAKLVFVMGLFLGAPVVVALFIALLANSAVGLALIGRRGIKGARGTTLPFAPFLAAGGIAAALAGSTIIHAYLSVPH